MSGIKNCGPNIIQRCYLTSEGQTVKLKPPYTSFDATPEGLTASNAVITDADGNLASSAVTSTELGHVSGVTSAIQTQINSKAPIASPTFTTSIGLTSGNITATNGNFSIGTSGKGIDFSGVGTATNILDDYEEGTWTPVLGGSGGTSGQTYSSQVGAYVKIGNQVFCTCNITLSNKGTITGNLRLEGLPFNAASGLAYYSALSIAYSSGITVTAGHVLQGRITGGSNVAFFYEDDFQGSTSTNLTETAITNSSTLFISFTYAT